MIICLSLFISMNLPIEFDRQSLFNTIEIDYVWTHAVLSAKLTTGDF